MEKTNMAIIGSTDVVLLFNTLGFKTVVMKDINKIPRLINELYAKNYKIIYLSEDIYNMIPETISSFMLHPFPILIPIPLTDVDLNVGKDKIKENVEKAIGINIF